MRLNRLASTMALPALCLTVLAQQTHAQQSPPAVHGDGTVDHLSRWVGTTPSGRSVLGDSIVTQSNGNIGIGVATPTSRLSVHGMVETTLAGFKFPDGTVQTTAAVTGLQSVAHDSTLTGDGTNASPLGLSVPLAINSSVQGVISVWDRNNTGSGLFARGGDDNVGGGRGGAALDARGGGSVSGFGGDALYAEGGRANSGVGGRGVYVRGGNVGSGEAGDGVNTAGGQSDDGSGGDGVLAYGGISTSIYMGGAGVRALGGHGESLGGPGVHATGYHKVPGSSGFGGNGVVATGGNPSGRGLIATGGLGGNGTGVEATGGPGGGTTTTAGTGLIARGGANSGPNSASGHGIVAVAGVAEDGATRGVAAAFTGRVVISGGDLDVLGDLEVTGTKNFKIDHPLDPGNKYLLHAAVESSEVLNVYSGNVVTDAKGRAVVTLPEWFEALNKDVRYQLTVIGTFAQAIVAEKVSNNRFAIRTSSPDVEVSWQVTGVRSDAVMARHPFSAVQEKPTAERGTYLNPEAFDLPEERGAVWVRYPEVMQQLRGERRIDAQQDPRAGRGTPSADGRPVATTSVAGQE